jgi:hypothetical protein
MTMTKYRVYYSHADATTCDPLLDIIEADNEEDALEQAAEAVDDYLGVESWVEKIDDGKTATD